MIVANPIMIKAYKVGIPGNGKPFPEGSKIAKLQWSFKKSTEAPFVVDVPDAPTQAFFIEKDSKRFPNSGGWGYALNDDAATGKMTVDPTGVADCGHACHVKVRRRTSSTRTKSVEPRAGATMSVEWQGDHKLLATRATSSANWRVWAWTRTSSGYKCGVSLTCRCGWNRGDTLQPLHHGFEHLDRDTCSCTGTRQELGRAVKVRSSG